ncbi:MAG: YkoF family thiamine/hydroxymethylpyrimidine-binding protein [Pseudomonadota bacterium]
MQARAELSLYPLTEDYIPRIKALIDRLNTYDDLSVVTNAMSTQVTGDYDRVMGVVTKELKASFGDSAKAVCVMKLLPLD